MARVYLETSFVSYLAAPRREGRDPIAALFDVLGLVLPIICTPEELLGVANDH